MQCGGASGNLFSVVGATGEGEEGAPAPSNAMLALHGGSKASAVADIEGVRLEGASEVRGCSCSIAPGWLVNLAGVAAWRWASGGLTASTLFVLTPGAAQPPAGLCTWLALPPAGGRAEARLQA